MGTQLDLNWTPLDEGESLKPIDSVSTRDRTIDEAFAEFNASNPQVYNLLVKLAREVRRRGKRIGIGALYERLRWEYVIHTEGDGFKLNNNFRSRYARLIEAQEADLVDFFEKRGLRAE